MLGKRLKDLRKENDITQEELAKFIGVTTSMVGMYETDARKPSYEVLLKISKHFNVSTDYLLGKNDQRNPKEPEIPAEFGTPEEAMKFILEQNVIMGFGGFDIEKMSDEEVLEFANELLRQLQLISYKYKK